MTRRDELRLMSKVARLYYEHGLRQTEIAAQLDISQATISRLLKRAQDEQIVRITVSVPTGTHPEVEEQLQAAFQLKEAIVVEGISGDGDALRDLGAAAAFYVETTLKQGEVIGISSWSSTLLAMVDAMNPLPKGTSARVVQVLGGVGNPSAEEHAVHLVRRLATLVRGEPTFLPAPGVTGSAEARQLYLQDPFVWQAMQHFDQVTLALVGIGSIEPSRLLASSGNVFSAGELNSLRTQGAVGDICLHFFDAGGAPVVTPLHERVIGIGLAQLHRVRRCVGIAGGARKIPAILGALRGKHINVLITDLTTAEALLKVAP